MDNTNNTNDKEYKASFIIPQYMLSLVLPKCNLIHGEVLSSVYLQVALYMNNQKQTSNWRQNQSWISVDTISKNTGYNIRIVNNTLKLLQSLYLIDMYQQQNKVIKFSLLNSKLHSISEVMNFNSFLERELLRGMNKTLTQKYTTKFRNLESVINYPQNKRLTKNIGFYDINQLRDWILQANQIKKGSTLFFLTNVAMAALKYGDNDGLLLNLSQTERAVRLGTTQSTISRYIKEYIDDNFLVVTEGNINKPIKLGVNPEILNQNLGKVVKNNMGNKIVCPICEKDFYENRSLGVHISKMQDPKHKMLNILKKQHSSMDINQLYLDNKAEFDEFDRVTEGMYTEDTKEIKQQQTHDYLSIPCDCKMTCKECHKNWKLDFYNDCTHARKEAFEKEFGIEQEDKKMIKVASKNNTIQLTKEDFDVIKPTKKQKITSGDTAPDLVKYFYSLINGTSPNFGKECGQVKNLLKKNSAEDIRTTMDYLRRRGNVDLRFLNNSIKDAMAEKQYLIDVEVDGTEAYLVKMYYEGMGRPINLQTLVSDVRKIHETLNSGVTYEQAKITIKYMIDIKCQTINFIGYKVNEALSNNGKINSIQENPSYFNRDNLELIKKQLLNAKIHFKKIDDEFRTEAVKIARELFYQNKFMDKFSHFEWAWRVGLDLDYEMYQIAKNTQYKELSLNSVLQSGDLTEEQKQTITRAKANYENWLQNQLMKFEGAQSN